MGLTSSFKRGVGRLGKTTTSKLPINYLSKGLSPAKGLSKAVTAMKAKKSKTRYDPAGAGKRLRARAGKTTSRHSKRLYELMAKSADKKSGTSKWGSARGGARGGASKWGSARGSVRGGASKWGSTGGISKRVSGTRSRGSTAGHFGMKAEQMGSRKRKIPKGSILSRFG